MKRNKVETRSVKIERRKRLRFILSKHHKKYIYILPHIVSLINFFKFRTMSNSSLHKRLKYKHGFSFLKVRSEFFLFFRFFYLLSFVPLFFISFFLPFFFILFLSYHSFFLVSCSCSPFLFLFFSFPSFLVLFFFFCFLLVVLFCFCSPLCSYFSVVVVGSFTRRIPIFCIR